MCRVIFCYPAWQTVICCISCKVEQFVSTTIKRRLYYLYYKKRNVGATNGNRGGLSASTLIDFRAWPEERDASSPTAIWYVICMQLRGSDIWLKQQLLWRDALGTVINSRKLTDAQANPSTQRKRFLSPIWQITLYFTDKEQLYALLKIKEKKHILNQTHHMNRRLINKLT